MRGLATRPCLSPGARYPCRSGGPLVVELSGYRRSGRRLTIPRGAGWLRCARTGLPCSGAAAGRLRRRASGSAPSHLTPIMGSGQVRSGPAASVSGQASRAAGETIGGTLPPMVQGVLPMVTPPPPILKPLLGPPRHPRYRQSLVQEEIAGGRYRVWSARGLHQPRCARHTTAQAK